MQHFSFGLLSVAAAILFPSAYIVVRQLRRFGAWVQRGDGPKERAGAMVVILALFGLGVGSFAQPLWDQGVSCQAQGQPVVSCVFFPTR